MTYLNYLTANNYQINISAILNQLNWLESNNQLSITYISTKSSIPETPQIVEGFSPYFSTNNQIIFNKSKTLMGGINFIYQLPYVDGVTKSNGYYILSASMKMLLLNKKLQISLNGGDLLKTNKPFYYTEVNNIRHESSYYSDDRNIRLSIRYLFGNDKIKNETRETSNKEETKRLSF